jgi:hypothetical protein|tara:strand:+ start:354 stop:638 length:285 start_codon:yes stop_codon:yes gene_type:complete
MTKITNIDKTDIAKNLIHNTNKKKYEYTCPNTGVTKYEERFLLRIRLAQYTHWISDEINRLKAVREKIDIITDAIDQEVEIEEQMKEKEVNEDG